MTNWSFIVFCFNEEGSLSKVVKSILGIVPRLNAGDSEIIIINDGSTDGSAEIAEDCKMFAPNIRVIHHNGNLGIGQALITGYNNARFENVIAIPADGQFNLQELLSIPANVETDFISFYRRQQVGYSKVRVLISKFNKIFNRLIGLKLRDVNWVKVYRLSQLKSIQPLELNTSLVESEICGKLNLLGYKALEIPSQYVKRETGVSSATSWKWVKKVISEMPKLAVTLTSYRFGLLPVWWRKWGWQVMLLILSVGLIVARSPNLFSGPTLFAEEGAIWFQRLYTKPFWDAITFIFSGNGYFDAVPNIATAFAAHFFSIHNSAKVILFFGLISQLSIIALIIFGSSSLLNTPLKKILACSVFLLVQISTGEVWLTVLNAKCYYGLLIVLLYFEITVFSKTKNIIVAVLASLAVLTGPYAVVAASIFYIDAILKKRKFRIIQCGFIAIAILLQGMIFKGVIGDGRILEARPMKIVVKSASSELLRHQVFATILGKKGTDIAFELLHLNDDSITYRILERVSIPAVLRLLVIAGFLILLSGWPIRWNDRTALMVAYIALALLSCACSLSGKIQGRYSVTAYYLILFGIVSFADFKFRYRTASIAIFFLATAVYSNFESFFGDPEVLRRASYPSWEQQINGLRQGTEFRIDIPPSGWHVDLKTNVWP